MCKRDLGPDTRPQSISAGPSPRERAATQVTQLRGPTRGRMTTATQGAARSHPELQPPHPPRSSLPTVSALRKQQTCVRARNIPLVVTANSAFPPHTLTRRVIPKLCCAHFSRNRSTGPCLDSKYPTVPTSRVHPSGPHLGPLLLSPQFLSSLQISQLFPTPVRSLTFISNRP